MTIWGRFVDNEKTETVFPLFVEETTKVNNEKNAIRTYLYVMMKMQYKKVSRGRFFFNFLLIGACSVFYDDDVILENGRNCSFDLYQ